MRESTRKKEVGEYCQDAAEQADEEGVVYFLPELLTGQKVSHLCREYSHLYVQ